MKLLTQIEINILTFFKSGKFDFLELGQSKEWILNNFPDPDEIGIGETYMNSKIWYYGNIELHFYKNELSLIHSENISDLDGGQSIKLDKWILDNPKNLKLSNFIEKLNIERIDFTKKTELLDLEYIRLKIIESNVQLTFIDEMRNFDNPNEFTLSAFSLGVQ